MDSLERYRDGLWPFVIVIKHGEIDSVSGVSRECRCSSELRPPLTSSDGA
jgi:hypothetical protein